MRAHTRGTWALSKERRTPRLAHRLSMGVACAVLGAAVIVSASVGARGLNPFHTRLEMSPNRPFVHGRVFANADRCIDHRRVVLFRAYPNRRKLGHDEARPGGRWRVRLPGSRRSPSTTPLRVRGEYPVYGVKVKREVFGDGFVCMGARTFGSLHGD